MKAIDNRLYHKGQLIGMRISGCWFINYGSELQANVLRVLQCIGEFHRVNQWVFDDMLNNEVNK